MPSNKTQRRLFTFLFVVTVLILVIWTSYRLSLKNGLNQLRISNQQQLEQFKSHLDAQLARFQFLPELISKNDLLVELLNDPKSSSRTNLVNLFLGDINAITGASDTYLMDSNGLTIAASNWQSERPFVGRNFSFRPYFTQAMQGQLGRYYALGTTSGERGYYFAYPIVHAVNVIGAIVIKMDLSNIEQKWSNRDVQFLVHDPDGVIFITTQPEWLYHSIKPIDKATRQRITLSRRYGNVEIHDLGLQHKKSMTDKSAIITLQSAQSASTEYLNMMHDMPQAGWSVMILSPLDTIKQASLITVIIVVLIVLLLLLIALLTWQRYRRQQERERYQLEAQKQLEQEVSIRTADLRHEIEEHKHTEKVLRDTQGELIQTAKLALLGQMSASISHELNNPLAAIRSYADNARQFLSRKKSDQADENLSRIAELTERMGKISSQLKFFARKSSGQLDVVEIKPVVMTALDIVNPQTKNTDIITNAEQVQSNLLARVDIIQLEQVLINLITNAIHAIGDQAKGVVNLSTEQDDKNIMIHVDDNGPGISEEHFDKIFDPFFTTRKSGLGLGLSISARIIDSMHGRLSAINLVNGGARFTISLPSVE